MVVRMIRMDDSNDAIWSNHSHVLNYFVKFYLVLSFQHARSCEQLLKNVKYIACSSLFDFSFALPIHAITLHCIFKFMFANLDYMSFTITIRGTQLDLCVVFTRKLHWKVGRNIVAHHTTPRHITQYGSEIMWFRRHKYCMVFEI